MKQSRPQMKSVKGHKCALFNIAQAQVAFHNEECEERDPQEWHSQAETLYLRLTKDL
jgi:hypothetical protein